MMNQGETGSRRSRGRKIDGQVLNPFADVTLKMGKIKKEKKIVK